MANSGPRIAHVQSDAWQLVRRSDGTLVRIGVTLGDAAGIGPEVVIQALLHTHLHRRVALSVFIAAELAPWLRAACDRFGLPLAAREGIPGIAIIGVVVLVLGLLLAGLVVICAGGGA